MRIKRLMKRIGDCALGSFGLKVVKVSDDLENRPTGYAETRMLREIADAFDEWCRSKTAWPVSQLADSFTIHI